jgi:AcrR family transcriptional regulator
MSSRDEIIEKAAIVFSKKGYHGASMSDIAEACNMQKASLYHHVSSKQEILLYLLEKALDLSTECVAEGLKSEVPHPARFYIVAQKYVNTLKDTPYVLHLLSYEYQSLERANQSKFLFRQDQYENLWREFIIDGIEAGYFSCKNVKIVVKAIILTLNSIIMWSEAENQISLDEFSNSLIDTLLRSLLKGSNFDMPSSIQNNKKQNESDNWFDVFLSYSTKDKDEARKITTFLEDEGYRVFLSEKSIKPSAKWEDRIRDALKVSKVMCLLATPNSLNSGWVTTEWGAAWALDIPILPILFQCSAEQLPERLNRYQSINFHEMSKIVDVLKEIDK